MQPEPDRLSELFFAHRGKAVDKWEQYLAIYRRELSPYLAAGEPIRLLEIGVQNGGSLEIWREYLPAGSRITGVDIDPKVDELEFGEGIEVFVGDGSDRAVLDEVLEGRNFEVIIDDGSHQSSDIIATFEALFDRLAPGGKFIIEDLHASYWASYGGGFRAGGSAMAFLKDLVDALNADHFEAASEPAPELGWALRRKGRFLSRVSFYDSVAVIEKLPGEKYLPYRRVQSGVQAAVYDPFTGLVERPASAIAPILFGTAQARYVEARILGRMDEMRGQMEELSAGMRQAYALTLAAEETVRVMRDSTSWKLTAPLRWLGRVLAGLFRKPA